MDINDLGEVVGVVWACSDDGCVQRGFIWSASLGLRDLGSFIPRAINNRGDMAGSCLTGPFSEEPCVMFNGELFRVPIPPPGQRNGVAENINEGGDVIGWSYFEHSNSGARAFILDASGGFTWLDPGDGWSQGFDINDHGMATGNSNGPVFWPHAKRMIFLPANLPDLVTIALNNNGLVVGSEEFEFDDYSLAEAVLWNPQRGERRRLPDGDSAYRSSAEDINDHGQIVGSVLRSQGEAPHVVMWTLHIDLNITTPNTPSRWGLNTRQRLAWTYDGDAPQFQIDISRDGGDTWDFLVDCAQRSRRVAELLLDRHRPQHHHRSPPRDRHRR